MKKLMNYAVIAAIVFSFLGASTLVAQDWTKDQKEVWKVVETAWSKMQEGDLESSNATIHEQYLGWNQEMPLPTNKEKWVKKMEMMKDFATLEYYDIEPARILVYKDVAVVHYYYEQYIIFTKDDEKTEYNYKGKNTEFYIKEGGNWLLIGDMTVWDDIK